MVPKGRVELPTQGFSNFFSWVSPRIGLSLLRPEYSGYGVGRLCKIIVESHLLVSTPFLIHNLIRTWLGIAIWQVSPNSPNFSHLKLLWEGPNFSPSLYRWATSAYSWNINHEAYNKFLYLRLFFCFTLHVSCYMICGSYRTRTYNPLGVNEML